MAVLSRIFAAAAIISLSLVDVAGASAADHYGVAAQRARAHSHHERGANVHAVVGENRKRNLQKRCSSHTTSLTSTHHSTSTASHHSTTTTTANKEVDTPSSKSNIIPHGGKKALAWSGSAKQLEELDKNGIVAVYSWGATPHTAGNLKPMSMLWGKKNLEAFRKTRDQYEILMGMNEVNLDSQSGMSVSEAVSLWTAEIRPYSNKIRIAPSVTTANNGIPYLKAFFAKCGGVEGCGVDMLSSHIYDTSSAKVISYLENLYATFKTPIFLSEFACMAFYDEAPCTDPEAFMREVIAFCDKTSYMTMCAPYGWSSGLGSKVSLIGGNGKVTALGQAFLDA